MASHEISQHIKLDQRNHVEKLLLDQLTGNVRGTPLLTESQEDGA